MSDSSSHDSVEWVNTAELGYTPAPLDHFMLEANFIGGDDRLELAYYQRQQTDGVLFAKVYFAEGAQG
ncbi:MAG: hypothetical protein JRH20_27820, partial [Deltaproteobacteria bacterium]|nr:hypothetical protein [Deltaproteobacteria bacterium]